MVMVRTLTLTLLLALAACQAEYPAPAESTAPPADPAIAAAASAPGAQPVPPSPSAEPAPDLPERFRAVGTEPFWGAKVSGTTLIYSTPDYPDGMQIAVTRRNGPGQVILNGTIDAKPLELAISAGPCSDGMSDTIYPWTAVRTIGPDIARGCALED